MKKRVVLFALCAVAFLGFIKTGKAFAQSFWYDPKIAINLGSRLMSRPCDMSKLAGSKNKNPIDSKNNQKGKIQKSTK